MKKCEFSFFCRFIDLNGIDSKDIQLVINDIRIRIYIFECLIIYIFFLIKIMDE